MTEPPAILRPQPGRWRWVAFVVSLLLVVGFNLWYTNRVQHQAERRAAVERMQREAQLAAQQAEIARAWCILVVPVDDRARANPPRTEDDQKVAEAARLLRAAYQC